MKYSYKKRIQKLYKDEMKRKKEENRILIQLMICVLIFALLIIISLYFGDPLRP